MNKLYFFALLLLESDISLLLESKEKQGKRIG